MKKTLLFIGVLAACLNARTQAQTIANASFETWHNYTVGVLPPVMNLTAPTSWSGSDSLISFIAPLAGTLGGITINAQQQLFQSSLAHTGSFSAEVISKNLGDSLGVVPGMLVNAKVDMDLTAAASGNISDIFSLITYTGGTAITGQVDTVKAWISLDSATNLDEGSVLVMTTKTYQGSQGDSMGVVGIGTVTVPRGSAAFRQIAVPLLNASTDVPEKLITVFMSSDYSDSTIHEGNSMKVDDVTFSYKPGSGVSIQQPLLSKNKILVYPNPTTKHIYFNLDAAVKPTDFTLTITDINGRTISKEQMKQDVNNKDVSQWATGSYFYILSNEKANTKEQGKFIVE